MKRKEALDEVRLLDGGRSVAFAYHAGATVVECEITLDALRKWFWLEQGANEARIACVVTCGADRILAHADRKLRLRPGARVMLVAADFEKP